MKTKILGIIILLAGAGLLMAAVGQPMSKVDSCVVTVTTTATPVQNLAVTACGAPLPEEAFMAWNGPLADGGYPRTVYVGGAAVNTTTTAGGRGWCISSNTTACRDALYTARAAPSSVYMRVATGTLGDGGVDTTPTETVVVHAGGPL